MQGDRQVSVHERGARQVDRDRHPLAESAAATRHSNGAVGVSPATSGTRNRGQAATGPLTMVATCLRTRRPSRWPFAARRKAALILVLVEGR